MFDFIVLLNVRVHFFRSFFFILMEFIVVITKISTFWIGKDTFGKNEEIAVYLTFPFHPSSRALLFFFLLFSFPPGWRDLFSVVFLGRKMLIKMNKRVIVVVILFCVDVLTNLLWSFQFLSIIQIMAIILYLRRWGGLKARNSPPIRWEWRVLLAYLS